MLNSFLSKLCDFSPRSQIFHAIDTGIYGYLDGIFVGLWREYGREYLGILKGIFEGIFWVYFDDILEGILEGGWGVG